MMKSLSPLYQARLDKISFINTDSGIVEYYGDNIVSAIFIDCYILIGVS